MKKLISAAVLVTYLASLGTTGRTAIKLYEGGTKHNDLYLIAFSGYYLPLIADDLEINDTVIYYSVTSAKYTEE